MSNNKLFSDKDVFECKTAMLHVVFGLIFWQVKISYSKYCTSTVLHRHPQLCSKNYTHLYKISKICFKQNLLTKIINETVCKPYAKAGNYLIYLKKCTNTFLKLQAVKKMCVLFAHPAGAIRVNNLPTAYIRAHLLLLFKPVSYTKCRFRMELSGFKFKFNLIL